MAATVMHSGVLLGLSLVAALTACDASTSSRRSRSADLALSPASATTGGAARETTTLALSSPAFAPNGEIPSRYTCEGAEVSPPLAWSGVPDGTRSLALVLDDPDAPSGAFCHWAVFDIPADRAGLEEGYGAGRPGAGFREGSNGFGKPGYGGPCPPPGADAHHYDFRLLALREARLGLPKAPRCDEVLDAAQRLAIEQAELVGTFARKR
jgi:Raf kinase inhibitor-like YbhB/YbcL family protein